MKEGYVYILTNKSRSSLYTGVTSDIATRMKDHREGKGSVFCKTYGIRILVYYEFHPDLGEAIKREKQIKKWKREWKIKLIREKNPDMKDLLDKTDLHDGSK